MVRETCIIGRFFFLVILCIIAKTRRFYLVLVKDNGMRCDERIGT
jgi:hypothetical protein